MGRGELRFDHEQKKYAFVNSSGTTLYTESKFDVYDDKTREWGYFVDGKWKDICPLYVRYSMNNVLHQLLCICLTKTPLPLHSSLGS